MGNIQEEGKKNNIQLKTGVCWKQSLMSYGTKWYNNRMVYFFIFFVRVFVSLFVCQWKSFQQEKKKDKRRIKVRKVEVSGREKKREWVREREWNYDRNIKHIRRRLNSPAPRIFRSYQKKICTRKKPYIEKNLKQCSSKHNGALLKN